MKIALFIPLLATLALAAPVADLAERGVVKTTGTPVGPKPTTTTVPHAASSTAASASAAASSGTGGDNFGGSQNRYWKKGTEAVKHPSGENFGGGSGQNRSWKRDDKDLGERGTQPNGHSPLGLNFGAGEGTNRKW